MNQQRQVTPATIDLTPAHQVLRARVMGAIDCDPRFRIKRLNDEGMRTSANPYSIPSDTISNHCATSDLLVSFRGDFRYMLQCEMKTTRKRFGDRSAPEIFRDVKHVEYADSGKRNLRQFENLVKDGNHYWWYVIAQVHGLNEDDQDQLESGFGDQPAVLIEGRAPYPEAIRQYGPMRLNALLKVVRERIGEIGDSLSSDQALSTPISTRGGTQLNLLGDEAPDEAPKDDVPEYTMDTPLKMVVPTKAVTSTAAATHDARQPRATPFSVRLKDIPDAPSGKGSDAKQYAVNLIKHFDFAPMMTGLEHEIFQKISEGSMRGGDALKALVHEIFMARKIEMPYDRRIAAEETQQIISSPAAQQCLAMYINSFDKDYSTRKAGFMFSRRVYVESREGHGNLLAVICYQFMASLLASAERA